MQHARLRVDRVLNILTSTPADKEGSADKENGKWLLYNSKQKLRSYCLIVSWLHFGLALAYILMSIVQETDPKSLKIKRLHTHTTQSIGAWLAPTATTDVNTTGFEKLLDLQKCPIASTIPARDSQYIIQQTVLAGPGEIDTRFLLIAFHLLSWFFQFVTACDDRYYDEMNEGKTNVSHFFEYSISAPIMLIAICVQLGITDIYLITSIAGNCSACMLFGVVAEILSNTSLSFDVRVPLTKTTYNISAHWVAHFAGWGTIIIAYICASSNLIIFDRCISPKATAKMPEIIRGLIWIEGLLFMCFGFVQTYAFYARKKADNKHDTDELYKEQKQKIAYRTETAYILLSFTAKTILGVFILLGNSTFA